MHDNNRLSSPWRPVSIEEGAKLVEELQREVCRGHVLQGCSLVAIGRREDQDDVLFRWKNPTPGYAIVHLSYRKETTPDWHHTQVFDSLEAALASMTPTSDTLPYLAARLAINELNAETIKSTINALMNEGYYDDTCLAVIDSSPPRMDEVRPAFLVALKHFQVANPDQEFAVWILIEYHLRQIVEKRVDPYEGLCSAITRYQTYENLDCSRSKPKTTYVGESHSFHPFIGLYWGIDDLREQSLDGKLTIAAWSDIKRQIVAEAEEWLRELPTNAAYLQCLRQAEST